ncbi:hypothetical protein Celaphus_00004331 [Cervus elaphus hippelaphus]|uniref:Uncharacterized protein n=1 Tax=Cervus elaphus hippelaphus TaxID=46360 RepID=A0A212DBY3_CEREH|nr:hypothetical protein Celaphus_00004331 [Cervus elaphus hippelaphus]
MDDAVEVGTVAQEAPQRAHSQRAKKWDSAAIQYFQNILKDNFYYYFCVPDKTLKCNVDSLKGSPGKESEKKQQRISLKDVNKVLFLNVH